MSLIRRLWCSGRPIVVAAYGSGSAPAIHAAGAFSATVLLQNQSYWQVGDLEITNRDPSNPLATRYGVYVLASNAGAVRNIVLRNLSVHDVNGDPAVKTCGGIFAEITGSTTPTWFDSLVIEGCTITDVSPVGIANTSSWATRTLTGNTTWTPSLNVLVRNNTVKGPSGMALSSGSPTVHSSSGTCCRNAPRIVRGMPCSSSTATAPSSSTTRRS